MPNEHNQPEGPRFPLDVMKRIDDALEGFQHAWTNGQVPSLRDYLATFVGVPRREVLSMLLEIDVKFRREMGESPTPGFYFDLLPGDRTDIQEEFDRNQWETSLRRTMDQDANSEDGGDNENLACAIPHQIDRFQVHGALGRGGFGWVYRCYDPNMKEFVAVKTPRADRCLSEEEIRYFLKEASRATRLRTHPNIVRVREAQHRGNESFIVCDYIDGKSLAQRMSEGPCLPAETAQLIATVADALHHAHQHRLVHRDIKPGNILLDVNGTPYLTDFGMAALENEQYAEGRGIRGTPAYLSPEQARGDSHLAGPASDIFSLGIVLYEMLARVKPFHGDTRREVLEKILNQAPRSLRLENAAVPQRLEAICFRCLRKNPEDRYATAADLAADLRGWLLPRPETSAVTHPRTREGRPFGFGRYHLGWAILVLAGMALGVWWLRPWQMHALPGSNGADVPEKPGTRVNDPPPEPGEWVNLLTKEPGVLMQSRRLFVKKFENNRLWWETKGYSLFRLGTTTSRDYEIEVTFEQQSFGGQRGLFLGYDTQSPRRSKHQTPYYIAICPDAFSRKARDLRYLLHHGNMLVNEAGNTIDELKSNSPLVGLTNFNHQRFTMSVYILDGKITWIGIDHQQVPNLNLERSDAAGKFTGDFGVFGTTGSMRLTKARWKISTKEKTNE